MDGRNLPIQVIAVCSQNGDIRPIRFRMEDEEHCLITIKITEMICVKEINYAGIEALSFLCKAMINDTERMFELKYTILSHRWVLYRTIC